ncbi:MAG TPA: acetyl-CoA C-acetyltransferase, partial [Pseudomonas sp.]|nr:acetyl-CoA C-acetyltransferase [Pseudomonas sp.]
MRSLRRVAILGGNRIPFARSNGAYATASNQDMLTAALEGLIERYRLHGLRLGEVVAGAVLKHARDMNLTRECVLGSRLSASTPAYDIQQACGTGLEAALLVANKIALGQIDCGIAGGVDTTSDAPIAVSEGLRRMMLQANRGKTLGDRLKPFLGLRPHHLKPSLPRNGEPRTGLSMGEHCERMAKTWRIGRDEQDEMALRSHQCLARAYEEGWQDDLMTPFWSLTRDNNLRPDLTREQLAKLKPAFDRSDEGTLTAGNSTPLTDGASLVLLGTQEWADQHGLPVLAYLVDGETAAVDFVDGREGLLMAPVYAVPRLLARNNLTLQDFDYYEIHEAF